MEPICTSYSYNQWTHLWYDYRSYWLLNAFGIAQEFKSPVALAIGVKVHLLPYPLIVDTQQVPTPSTTSMF